MKNVAPLRMVLGTCVVGIGVVSVVVSTVVVIGIISVADSAVVLVGVVVTEVSVDGIDAKFWKSNPAAIRKTPTANSAIRRTGISLFRTLRHFYNQIRMEVLDLNNHIRCIPY